MRAGLHGRPSRFGLLGLAPFMLVVACVAAPGDSTSPSPPTDSLGPPTPSPSPLIPSPSPSSVLLGTSLLTEHTIPESGITLSPPGDTVPATSAAAAYGLCFKYGGAACAYGYSPTSVQLAFMTDTQYGPVDSKGKLTLAINHKLVWVISWLGITCPPGNGPPPPSGAPVETPGHFLCDKYAFIDATTGKSLLGYEEGHH